MWTSFSANHSGAILELARVRAHPRERRLRRLLHHLAELAGDRQPSGARVCGRLDEEDVPTDGRVGKPGRDTGVGRPPAGVGREPARAEPFADTLLVDLDLLRVPGRNERRRLPAERRDLALEVAHAGLARVLRDHQPQRLVRDRDPALLQAVRRDLLRHEVPLRDPELLLVRVAGELDHVHPVEQRPRDRVERVRGADEEHLREVVGQVEIVVAEARVLLGVEHFEHRRGRIAAEVGAHLVDLVDQEDGIRRLGVADRADDRARHGADVRPPVPADLRLVANAADRDAGELAAERARDRVAERRLAHARRPDEAEDRAGEVVLQLRDGQVLDDPLLHLLEVEMVLVEDLARVLEVEIVFGDLVPGQGQDPVEVGADDAVLGSRRRQPLEPAQLPQHRLLDLLGQALLLDLLPQLVDLGLLVVGLAELRLDRLQLLSEEELALALVDLAGDLRLDLRAELRHLDLAAEDQRDLPQPLLDVGRLEQLLPLLGLQPQRRGDQVGERCRVVDVRGRELQLFGQVRRHPDDVGELLLHRARERFHLGRFRDDLRQVLQLGDEIGLVLDLLDEPDPLDALDEDPQRPVGHLDHLVDDRDGADAVEVIPARRVGLLVLDREKREHPLAGDDVVDQLDRALLADGERRHRLGEDDGLLQRQDREPEPVGRGLAHVV